MVGKEGRSSYVDRLGKIWVVCLPRDETGRVVGFPVLSGLGRNLFEF